TARSKAASRDGRAVAAIRRRLRSAAQPPANVAKRTSPRATIRAARPSSGRVLRLLVGVLRRALRDECVLRGHEGPVLQPAVDGDVPADPERIRNRAVVDDWDDGRPPHVAQPEAEAAGVRVPGHPPADGPGAAAL